MAYSTALLAQTLHLHCPWSSPPHTSAIQPLTCRPRAEARQQNDSVFSEFQVPLHLKFKLEPGTGLRVQEGTKKTKVGSGQSCRPRALHSPQRGGQRHFCVLHCPAAPCEVKDTYLLEPTASKTAPTKPLPKGSSRKVRAGVREASSDVSHAGLFGIHGDRTRTGVIPSQRFPR